MELEPALLAKLMHGGKSRRFGSPVASVRSTRKRCSREIRPSTSLGLKTYGGVVQTGTVRPSREWSH